MPKNIEYPRASFKAAQEMAAAVDSLGGSCSSELCAEKMGNKLGGAFNYIVSSAQKFRLITYKSGQLSTTPLYREIKLSYTEEEKRRLLISSFLSPAVFTRLYERFKGKELPIAMLDKMLIKEYDVDENAASRIKKYFVDGAKSIGLLNPQNQLASLDDEKNSEQELETEEYIPVPVTEALEVSKSHLSLSDLDEFIFQITGPGINSKIAIREEEDFLILDAMIRKIKKSFGLSN